MGDSDESQELSDKLDSLAMPLLLGYCSYRMLVGSEYVLY